MLLIKKESLLTGILVNYKPMVALKNIKNLKKKNSHITFVRAPKHFNIGRLKVKNFNSKYYKICANLNYTINTDFFFSNNMLFSFLRKTVSNNILNNPVSFQVNCETKIKIIIICLGI